MKIDICTFMIISRSVLLKMRNVSDKSCRENQNTHFMFNNFLFRKSCRLWDNVEIFFRAGRPHRTMWSMCTACWKTKATHIYSEYVTLTAFPLQKWLHKRASLLGYTYVASLVKYACRYFFWAAEWEWCKILGVKTQNVSKYYSISIDARLNHRRDT